MKIIACGIAHIEIGKMRSKWQNNTANHNYEATCVVFNYVYRYTDGLGYIASEEII